MTDTIIDYEPRYYRCALQYQESTAILVAAYNRPEYFKEALASYEATPEAQTLPFFFFLDGGPQATQDQNEALIRSSRIAHPVIIRRHRNYGCSKNLIDARRFLFDWCQFNRVIVLEDDIIVSRYYFRTLISLHVWARTRYLNVGVVQSWSYCFLAKEEKKALLADVHIQDAYWWSYVTYCLDREVWQAISPILYAYERQFVDPIPWTDAYTQERSKPGMHASQINIRIWVSQLMDYRPAWPIPRTIQGQQVSTKTDLRDLFIAILYEITNQDLMTGFALWMAGYVKLETVVNRACHIGRKGVTIDEARYKQFQHHRIVLDDFDEDRILTDFKWHQDRG